MNERQMHGQRTKKKKNGLARNFPDEVYNDTLEVTFHSKMSLGEIGRKGKLSAENMELRYTWLIVI